MTSQDTEAHRHACEVKFVAQMDEERRRKFFEGVDKKRSREAAKKLREDVWKIVKAYA